MRNGAKGKKKVLHLNIDTWKIETWTKYESYCNKLDITDVLTPKLGITVFSFTAGDCCVNCRQGDMVTMVIYWLLIVLILLDGTVDFVSSTPWGLTVWRGMFGRESLDGVWSILTVGRDGGSFEESDMRNLYVARHVFD